MDFEKVIGQDKIKQQLIRLIDTNHVPHALLFCGAKGSGKLPLAIAFATYLIQQTAVNKANAKIMLEKLEHPDLHFTYPTIKLQRTGADYQPISNDFTTEWHSLITKHPYITIEQWTKAMGTTTQQAIITGAESDYIYRQLSIKASQGGYKIVLIWLPERMNLTAANKLLKLLEEPTPKTLFLLVSEEPEKLLDTITSRTQRIELKRLESHEIENELIIHRALNPVAAKKIARIANGDWNKVLELLNPENEDKEFLEKFKQLMRLCYKRKFKDLKLWSDTVAEFGREKQKRMLSCFQHQIRENFISNFQLPELTYMTEEEEAFAKNFSRFINEANVIEINELLEKSYSDIGQNANPKILFYDMILRLIYLILGDR